MESSATKGTGTTRSIIDASSAILLYKVGLIDLCCQRFQLLMTRSVFEEVTVPQQSGADALCDLADRRPGIVLLDDPLYPDHCNTSTADIGRLDRGERDSLFHYLHGAARFVVIDDGKAVRVCRRHHIPHVNALLFPKLLYFSKRLSMDQMDHFFSRIRLIGRYSERVVDWARDCGAGQLDFFLMDENKDKKRGRR